MQRAFETPGGTIIIESNPRAGRINVSLARGLFKIAFPLDLADATAIAEALDAAVVESTPTPKRPPGRLR